MKQARAAMAVLVRHKMVSFTAEESGRLVYGVDGDHILAILRYPHYISSVRTSHGELAGKASFTLNSKL